VRAQKIPKGGIIRVWGRVNSLETLHSAPMLSRTLTILLLLGLAATAPGQDSDGELTKVKEQELEEVRERISELKQSMDAAAGSPDR